MTKRFRIAVVVLVMAVIVGLSFGPIMGHLAAGRVRAAAAARGLTVSWRRLTVSGLRQVRLTGVVAARTQAGSAPDSLFQADSLAVALDLGSLLGLRPRVGSLGLWHAQIHLPARSAAEPDTLEPDDRPAGRTSEEDQARAARFRHSAESWVRLLLAPARRLPRLELKDVAISTGSGEDGEDASIQALRIAQLHLEPVGDGIRLSTIGSLQLDRGVPFSASFTYDREDRIRGEARFLIPDSARARTDPLLMTAEGTLHQNRQHARERRKTVEHQHSVAFGHT